MKLKLFRVVVLVGVGWWRGSVERGGGGKEQLLDFLPSFNKWDTFCGFRFAFLYTNPFLKGVYSKRKELAPTGNQSFPFKADPFPEGTWLSGPQTGSHNIRFAVTNGGTSTRCRAHGTSCVKAAFKKRDRDSYFIYGSLWLVNNKY